MAKDVDILQHTADLFDPVLHIPPVCVPLAQLTNNTISKRKETVTTRHPTCYQNLLIFAYGMNDDLSLCDLRFVNVVKKSKLSTAVNVKDFTL